MEGIKYVQSNRIVVDPESADENSPLSAEGSNSIVTENEIWFDPPVPDFSDLEDVVNNYNDAVAAGTWTAELGSETESYLSNYNAAPKYANKYGFVCGVISYSTTQYVCRHGYGPGIGTEEGGGVRIGDEDGELTYPEDEIFDYYDGDEMFWYLQNAKLDDNAQRTKTWVFDGDVAGNSSSTISPDGCLRSFTWTPMRYYDNVEGNEAEKILTGENWSKLRFYSYAYILASGQLFLTSGQSSLDGDDVFHAKRIYMFNPNFTGNKGVLPVGLVMLRDIVKKTDRKNLNNFGEYGFVIAMPLFIEPSQVVRGLSLGKEMFVVGNGLKAEVFFAITTNNHPDVNCVVSNANLGYGQDGNLDVLFSGKDGVLRLSKSVNPLEDVSISCTNVFHAVLDFSVPGNSNGVFYFNKTITYDMGVKSIVFGMRPYDINGNGKEYPPKENPYGTDTSYLGNYALVDISDKKFYLL